MSTPSLTATSVATQSVPVAIPILVGMCYAHIGRHPRICFALCYSSTASSLQNSCAILISMKNSPAKWRPNLENSYYTAFLISVSGVSCAQTLNCHLWRRGLIHQVLSFFFFLSAYKQWEGEKKEDGYQCCQTVPNGGTKLVPFGRFWFHSGSFYMFKKKTLKFAHPRF